MGIVIKQSFWGTVIAYLGVVIAYFNTLYLRPEFLTLGEIGVLSLITANAMMISPFCSAGMPGTWMREFPIFKDNQEHSNQFFTFQLIWVVIVNGVVLGIGFLLDDLIIEYLSEDSPEYIKYLSVTALIILVNSLFDMFFAYSKTALKITFPSFLRDIFLRVGMIALIGGYALGWWNFDATAKGIGLFYVGALTLLIIYVMGWHKLRITLSLNLLETDLIKSSIRLGGYFMLLALSFALLNNISYMQITQILGEDATGIFTICFFIGVIVEMPRRNMIKVLAPIFSKAMEEKDMDLVERMYKKGSLTMSILGGLLTIGIFTNIQDLFDFIPKGESISTGLGVVVMVCLAKMSSMAFSFSQEIIVFSNKYKYTLYLQVVAAIILIVLNAVLIPKIGIVGAGIGYFIAYFVHGLVKYFLAKKWFGVSPFSRELLKLTLVVVVTSLIAELLPLDFHPIVNILVRSVVTTIIYLALVYKLNLSSDINQLIKTTFEKILIR